MENHKLEVELAIMEIREELINYFKGDCVSVLNNRYVASYRVDIEPSRLYVRQRALLKDNRKVFLNNSPILGISRQPDTLKIYNKTLTRSSEMKTIKQAIEKFMSKYLKGVDVVQSSYGSLNQEVPDKDRFKLQRELVHNFYTDITLESTPF